jgi:RNA polymerase primary sigma factor
MNTAVLRTRRTPAAGGRPGPDGAIHPGRCGADGPPTGAGPIGGPHGPDPSVLRVFPGVRDRDGSPMGEGLGGRTTRLDDRSEGGPAIAAHIDDLRAARARRILGARLRYIHHPGFDDPAARDAILAPAPEPVGERGPDRGRPSRRPAPYVAGYGAAPVLSREQEAHLFRRMNYLKYLAGRLGERVDPARPRAADLDEIERLRAEALAVRNRLVESNLRLVVSVVWRSNRAGQDVAERVSDGNVALLQAVDHFDFARGHRFSTYATWAITNELARKDRLRSRRRGRSLDGHEESLEAGDAGDGDWERQEDRERSRQAIARLLVRLNDRERRILVTRHGLGGAPEQTLIQIGQDLGISKERVRQIEARARVKLRKFARLESLDPSTL